MATAFGTFDNVYYRNSDDAVRNYQAMELLGNYQLRSNWSAVAQWTVQLKNEGNYEGESANAPGSPSVLGDYPELLVEARNFPMGRLDDYQRHKVRVWSTYMVNMGRFGSVDVTPMWRYNSALTYSLAANSVPLSAVQRARNPGYARLPGSGANGSQTLFFAERGSEEFAGYGLVDLGVTYQVPVWRTLKPWLKLEVLNVMDNNKLIAWDTTITVDPASALDADGLPTAYLKGARFGQGTSTAAYPRPRPGLTGGRTSLRRLRIAFLNRLRLVPPDRRPEQSGLLFFCTCLALLWSDKSHGPRPWRRGCAVVGASDAPRAIDNLSASPHPGRRRPLCPCGVGRLTSWQEHDRQRRRCRSGRQHLCRRLRQRARPPRSRPWLRCDRGRC